MVDIKCVKCGNVFSENYDTYDGAVSCPKCGREMRVTVIDGKVKKIMRLGKE